MDEELAVEKACITHCKVDQKSSRLRRHKAIISLTDCVDEQARLPLEVL